MNSHVSVDDPQLDAREAWQSAEQEYGAEVAHYLAGGPLQSGFPIGKPERQLTEGALRNLTTLREAADKAEQHYRSFRRPRAHGSTPQPEG